jgi:segregation and condensation protein B
MPSDPDMISFHARLLEAILFIAERPVSLDEIKQRLLINEDEIAQLISLLEQNLKARNSFIELIKSEQGQAFEMRINEGIKKELDAFRTKKSLSKDLLQTLAYIALEQPIKYGDLKKVRGQKTREHVETLEKEGYIKQEPSGKTSLLTTTLYFASVFNIDPDHIKETFKEQIAKRMQQLIDKKESDSPDVRPG